MEFRAQASSDVFVVNQSPAILSQRPCPWMHVIDNGFKSLFDDFQQSEDQSTDPQSSSGPPLNAGQSDSHTVYHRPGQQTITQFVVGNGRKEGHGNGKSCKKETQKLWLWEEATCSGRIAG